MVGINPQYGSELHLLRMMGRHRNHFNDLVTEATGADAVEWLDFPSGELRSDGYWDREWQHLHLLLKDDPAAQAWRQCWPASGSGPNWDAVGRLSFGTEREWLLM